MYHFDIIFLLIFVLGPYARPHAPHRPRLLPLLSRKVLYPWPFTPTDLPHLHPMRDQVPDNHEANGAMATDGTSHGPARPRRPDSETLTYLRSLEPLIDRSVAALLQRQQQEQGRGGCRGTVDGDDIQQPTEEDEEEAEERALLVSNLINELMFKVASLAMDRHAAPLLEKLARLCTRKQLARLLEGCLGYAASLASNRYSSHVLQTLLSLAGPMIEAEMRGEDEDEGEDEDADAPVLDVDGEETTPKSPVTLCGSASKLAEELHDSWLSLIYDICGTHSMRALFCLLTGMPVVAERRGKNAKHQHAIETAIVLDFQHCAAEGRRAGNTGEAVNLHTTPLVMFQVPDTFSIVLDEMIAELGRIELMTLHQTLCDAYANPALCLLLQAVARKEGAARQELTLSPAGLFFNKVVQKALCTHTPSRCAEVVYAMAGESLSSRFLEAVLWHTDPSTFLVQFFEICMQGKVMEYAEDEVANFVLQTWLQRTESAKQIKVVLEELGPSFGKLVKEKRRSGVLWRLAGACLRLGKGEKKIVKALLLALGGKEGEEVKGEGTTLTAAVRAVQTLLALRIGQEDAGGGEKKGRGVGRDDGRLYLSVPGARLLECVMRFPGREGGEMGVGWVFCQAVLELPSESLVAIAKDNVGSRTILDPLLELSSTATAAMTEATATAGDTKKRKENGCGKNGSGSGGGSSSSGRSSTSQLADHLADKLRGHFASLALHPVGYHVLTKCFTTGGLSLEGKRAIAQELMQAESRLAGCHFGRRALGVVGVSLFRGNRKKWEELQREGKKKKQVLDNLFEMLEREVVVAGKGQRKRQVKEGDKEEGEGGKMRSPSYEKEGKDGESFLDLLMGNKQGKKETEKKKEEEGREEEEGGGDLGFVLEAIKRSGCGSETLRRSALDNGYGRKRKISRGASSEEQERALPRRRKDVPAANAAPSSAVPKPKKKYRHDNDSKHARGTAVEKAQRLLGTRTMMSKSELLTAVEDLERDVKGGRNGGGSRNDAPEVVKTEKKSSSKT